LSGPAQAAASHPNFFSPRRLVACLRLRTSEIRWFVRKLRGRGDGVQTATTSSSSSKQIPLAPRIEAVEMFEEIKRYHECGVFFMCADASSPLCVKLYRPGLTESRPALVHFDSVQQRRVDQDLLASGDLTACVVSVKCMNSQVSPSFRHGTCATSVS
jgi:hypothetical protein